MCFKISIPNSLTTRFGRATRIRNSYPSSIISITKRGWGCHLVVRKCIFGGTSKELGGSTTVYPSEVMGRKIPGPEELLIRLNITEMCFSDNHYMLEDLPLP